MIELVQNLLPRVDEKNDKCNQNYDLLAYFIQTEADTMLAVADNLKVFKERMLGLLENCVFTWD